MRKIHKVFGHPRIYATKKMFKHAKGVKTYNWTKKPIRERTEY